MMTCLFDTYYLFYIQITSNFLNISSNKWLYFILASYQPPCSLKYRHRLSKNNISRTLLTTQEVRQKYINENLLNTVNYIKKRTWKTDKSIWSKDTDPVYEQSHCVTGQRFSGQWPLLHSQHWQAVNHWHCMIAATTQHKQTNTHQLRKYILNLLHENIMHILLLLSADICYSWHVLH